MKLPERKVQNGRVKLDGACPKCGNAIWRDPRWHNVGEIWVTERLVFECVTCGYPHSVATLDQKIS